MLIRELIEESASKFADIKAVKWLEKKDIKERSYKELGENVVLIRKGLKAEGFTNKHIAFVGESSVFWIECFIGVITGSNVSVPLDFGLPTEDLVDLINRSDSEGLFVSLKKKGAIKDILENCPKIKKIWILSDKDDKALDAISKELDGVDGFNEKIEMYSELKKSGVDSEDDSAPTAEKLATIMFTSGTTGKSKGVMLSQENFATNVEAVAYGREPGLIMMSVLPIHHAFSLVMDWFNGLSKGASICINDSLMHMTRNMGIYKPQIMLMVPLMIETIYKQIRAIDESVPKAMVKVKIFGENLDTIFTGGAHLDPFYIEKFKEYGIDIYEGYGMSECSPVISANMPEAHKAGSIGKPVSNAEIKFENGEILVRGTSVMQGYYNMPEETSETLKDGWLHTGDKGYMDEDGFLFINGRVKNLIILSNGENVSPEEIENKLGLTPLVGEIIITGENNGLVAHIFPDRDYAQVKGLSEEDIATELQKIIDEYDSTQPSYKKIVSIVVRKNPFIKNSTRKIKRQEVLVDEPQ
ncbi:MAG: AMP-binding protein [Lachnospiraceae bacterium]|nr:AMP-binding protein [Lachnospiraceae bacterium]